MFYDISTIVTVVHPQHIKIEPKKSDNFDFIKGYAEGKFTLHTEMLGVPHNQGYINVRAYKNQHDDRPVEVWTYTPYGNEDGLEEGWRKTYDAS